MGNALLFADDDEKERIAIMIGIVLGCVCISILIVVAIWYYFKKKEEKENQIVNQDEYHIPKLNINEEEIEEVLDKKRKESMQYGESRKLATKQRTHNIVATKESE